MARKNDAHPSILVLEADAKELGRVESLISEEVHGCVFMRAQTIQVARQFLQTTPPNLLIMDLHFSDGDSIELLRDFPREKRAFPILVITRDKSEDALKQMFDLGSDDFLQKPLDDLIFQSKVRSLLNQHYISPLSFLGKREGLGDLRFRVPLTIDELDENKIVLLAPFPIAKTTPLTIELENIKLQATIQSSERTERAPGFLVTATLDILSEENSRRLRKYLVQLALNAPSATLQTK